MSKREPINIPTIRGRILERLQRAPARERDSIDFGETVGDITLRSPDERGTVALACLILENIREAGGSRASSRTLESVLKKVLATLGPKEVMDIEIEAYEMLLWIGKSIDPDWQVEENLDIEDINPHDGPVELIQFAIANATDLELDYYSRNRGELTHRRVTPISFEAETYLHAYCHLRRDERIFRVSRIADMKPVGGWSRIKKVRPQEPEKEEKDTGQMSLID